MNDRSEAVPGPIVVVGAHVQSLFMQVERIPTRGETVLGWGFDEPVDGGKATNQAIAAARLGAPVILVSLVGSDRFGRSAVELLKAEQVQTRWVTRRRGRTDVGFVMLGPEGIPAITSSWDLNRTFDAVTVQRARLAFAAASVVVCQLEAPDDVAVAAFGLARRRQATTILNPAPARSLPPELVRLTDVLVPNEHEARQLLGRHVSIEDLASSLRRTLGFPAVVVTAAERGAWLSTEHGTTHHAAPVVEAVDSTGAGDVFVAALATRLRLGDELDAAVGVAVDAASRAVTRAGTIPSFPYLTELSAPVAPGLVTVEGDGHDPS